MSRLFIFLIIVFLILPLFRAQAVEIVDGDLIRVTGDFDVYIVKLVGAKKFKRLVLNPEIFNQYGHLKWENIKSVSSAEQDEFTTSQVVRAVGDTKVYRLYPNGDAGEKRWIKTVDDFLDLGYDWDAIYTINSFERDFYLAGADLEAPRVPEQPVVPAEPAVPSRDPMTISVPINYSTIGAALNEAIDGDTISIKAGTYKENIVIDNKKGIKLIGEAVGSTIIDGNGSGHAITISGGSDILIQKLTIKSKDKYGVYCPGENSITATLKNNWIIDSGWGIVADKNCQLTILNNLIYNNKHSANTDGAGILIDNNFSYNITSEIRNNTIDGNYHGIWSEDASLKVINNIITSNIGGKGSMDSTGIYYSGEGKFDSSYNDVWGNGFDFGGDAVPGNGSIVQDPDFLSAYTRDYRLKHGSTDYSPCIDAGHPDMIYWDAVYSSNTTRNDMGVYGGPDNNW